MPSISPDQDPHPASVDVGTRLLEERAALAARVAQLTEDMASFFEASRDSNADDEHDPEGQTIAFERAQLSAVTDQARRHLEEIDAALQRVAKGTFGICDVCDQPMDPRRLDARPTARACVRHVAAHSSRP
ncbi:TraR/DksA family transcriptional regulator [Ornithinimicrobium sp. W1679]|uniref:TraR/DksA family transcriptional regulator n=1 Tax=unclassified Ornithinimicrobium TaxID=2615080 RepID=UPI003CECC3CF